MKDYCGENIESSSDSLDPQFLTFRYNSPNMIQTSSRSIYSQRQDYKSLQKYPLFDDINSERDPLPAHSYKKQKEQTDKNMFKTNKLRSARSHQKFPFLEEPNQQQNQKNKELKDRLSKLVRLIKKEQRKGINIEKDLQDLLQENKQIDTEILEQEDSIAELTNIKTDNKKECNKIIEQINFTAQRNTQLSERVEELEEQLDTSEISVETSKQDSARDRAYSEKLKQGIAHLTEMRDNADFRLQRFKKQIENMRKHIDIVLSFNLEIGYMLGAGQENNSSGMSLRSSGKY